MNKYNINGIEILAKEQPTVDGLVVKLLGVLLTDLELYDVDENSVNVKNYVSSLELTFSEPPIITKI